MSNDNDTPKGPTDKQVENSEKQRKAQEQTTESTKTQVELAKEILKLEKEKLKETKAYLEILRDTAITLNDMEEARKKSNQLLEEEILALANGDKDRENALKEFIKDSKDGNKAALTIREEIADLDKEQLEMYRKQLRANEQVNQGQLKYGANQKAILGDMAQAIGIVDKYSESFLGKLYVGLEVLAKGGEEAEEAMMALRENFEKTFNLKNISLNVFNKIYDNTKRLFNSFDEGQASLARTTAQGREFNEVLYDVGQGAQFYGVTMQDASAAIGTLINGTSNFISLNKSQQQNIAETVAKMEKLGVSAADSAAMFQNLNQGLGISADESIRLQRDLAMAGVEIGISAERITKDFVQSLSTLMVYGREAFDVFSGIAAAAKAAEVATSTLLTIASKFDTFAGSAEGVGKLNALLGTQLSTTEMLMATEDERIRMLVESVQSQGVAFRDMDRFTQKAIANAAGITDMAEANKIFGMSLKAYDENERKLKASKDAQQKFDDAVSKTVKVTEKLQLLGASIVVALEPFFEMIATGADYLTEFFNSMSTEGRERLGGVLAIFSGFVMAWPILKLVFGGISLFGSVTMPLLAAGGTAAGAGLASTAAGMEAAGAAGSMSAAGVASFGVALAEIGLVIAGVVLSLSLLVGAVALAGKAFATTKFDVQTAEAEAKMAEFHSKTAQAASAIVNGDHEAALESIKAIVGEMNKLGETVEVRSTIENLALITAGKASSMTGERITASQTNVTANVKNFFEGMEMNIKVDGATFKGYVESVAADVIDGR